MSNKLNFYIGFDYSGNPIGVLLADSEEKVRIAWQAMKENPHTIEKINSNKLPHSNGLFFILTSEEKSIRGTQHSYREWKRGL